MLSRFWTLLRHAWIDERDSHRALPQAAIDRLGQRVSGGERRHRGEIRVVVEAGLPLSYVWRHVREGTPLTELSRQRAVMLFGKLRVWDTELNNGVLIYLLLAEHRIEVVADRALNQVVAPERWQALVARLGTMLAAGNFEAGLQQSVDEVSELLAGHFALPQARDNPNELPDQPLRL